MEALMSTHFFRPLAQFFRLGKRTVHETQKTKGTDLELLYSHRLKRSFPELPHFGKPGNGRLIGKLFLTSLIVALVALPFSYPLAAGSGVGLSVYSGAPQTITVSGWGFTNGETVNVYLNNTSGSPVAHSTAGVDSQFSVPVTIPAN